MNLPQRKTIRLKNFDYSKDCYYFITICCKDRLPLFGKVINEEMILNEAGKFAEKCWMNIPKHFQNAIIHEFVIMPDHIHGIIELTIRAENIQPRRVNQFQKLIPGSIGSIVKGFKIGVTKWFRYNTKIEMVWQRNYYENVIRDQRAFDNISKYIKDNPKNLHSKN
ncbi:MAG: transposase [Bacteroidota bacterium]